MKNTMVPRRFDFWTPRFGDEEKALVSAAIDSGFLNDGEVTTRFEAQVATLLGCKHVVATTSGTAAIFLALAGIGIRSGDEVIVPDVTFIATANAVSMTGATPILVDVDPLRLTIDPECVERAVTTRTKAIVPVHVSGRAADLSGVFDVAKQHGLLVVEDAAEAFLSRHDGRCLGTFGIAGCFSLSPNKTITTGQGGLVVTNDDELHVKLRELKDQGRSVRGTGGDDVHRSVGYNFKFTDLQAAVGLAQLKTLPCRLESMKRIYRGYAERLKGIKDMSVLRFSIERGEIPQWTDVLVEHRDDLYQHLAAQGIMGRRYWHPLHTQAPYRLESDHFPISSRQAPRAMWLPSAFTLSEDDVRTVSAEILKFLTVTNIYA